MSYNKLDRNTFSQYSQLGLIEMNARCFAPLFHRGKLYIVSTIGETTTAEMGLFNEQGILQERFIAPLGADITCIAVHQAQIVVGLSNCRLAKFDMDNRCWV